MKTMSQETLTWEALDTIVMEALNKKLSHQVLVTMLRELADELAQEQDNGK